MAYCTRLRPAILSVKSGRQQISGRLGSRGQHRRSEGSRPPACRLRWQLVCHRRAVSQDGDGALATVNATGDMGGDKAVKSALGALLPDLSPLK